MTPPESMESPQPLDRITKATLAAQAASDRKAEDVVALDVRELTSFADTFVVATGRSDRQVRAIADAIVEALAARGAKAMGVEGHQEGRWVLLDYGDLVAHVFQRDVRDHYDLDRLWSDAEPLPLAGSGGPDGDSPSQRRVER